MTDDVVTYCSEDRIAVITMNRPDRLNRLDGAMVAGLEAAWRQFEGSEDRVAVLTGAGERAFTAGADLQAIPHDLYRGVPGVGVAVTKPVIGAVSGWCVGGGMVLTTFCDLLVATETARFSYPEVKVGFSGGLISTLVARIPHKIAMELLLLGEPIDAARAYEVGYVNRVVAEGTQVAVAMELARAVAAAAPLPVELLKRFAGETIPKGPTERAGIARAAVDAINASDDGAEGIAAFFDKRPPDFKGR